MSAPPKLELIDPFRKATEECFSTMMGIKVASTGPYVEDGKTIHHEISGVIGVSGEGKGEVSISFPRQTALNIVKVFFGGGYETGSFDIPDAVGEILNIIAGSAKVDLDLRLSLPTVVIGAYYNLVQPTEGPSLVIPFNSDEGTFDVIVNLKVGSFP